MKNLLKIMSIVMMVFAVIMAVMGVVALVGGGAEGTLISQTDEEGGAAVATVVGGLGAVTLIVGVLNFIIGLCGYKGAQGAKKPLMVAIVLTAIGLIGSIFTFTSGTKITWDGIVSVVIQAVFLASAVSVYKQN